MDVKTASVSARRAHGGPSLVALAAVCVVACTYTPTQILVVLDTDLRSAPLRVELVVRPGSVNIPVDGPADRSWWVGAPGADANGHWPASFGIVAAAGHPGNACVSFLVTARTLPPMDPLTLRRAVRICFVSRVTQRVQVFLSSVCARTDRVCAGGPCTGAEFCEQRGETCGNDGACVPLAIAPMDGGAPDARTSGVDATAETTSDIVGDTRADSAPRDVATDVPTACAAGRTRCAGVCVDLSADATNCGACGQACAAGRVCTSGSCRCAGAVTDCGGRCVDTSRDTAHCGMCGNACVPNEQCNAGVCVCPGPNFGRVGTACRPSCGGVAMMMGAASSDCCPLGCTGRVLGGPGVSFDCTYCCEGAGSCVATCPVGQTRCGAACVVLTTDPSNCGACGTVCAGVTPDCCTGRCFDLDSNRMNCGACGARCALPNFCAGGVCGP